MAVRYVVMRLQSWDSLDMNIPYPVSKRVPAGSPEHFLPVFDNREDAEGWSDGGKYGIAQIQAAIESEGQG